MATLQEKDVPGGALSSHDPSELKILMPAGM